MKRGRKSTGELTVVVGGGSRTPPAPPSELSDAQAMVWRDVVCTLPGDWIGRGAHACWWRTAATSAGRGCWSDSCAASKLNG